MSHPPHGWWRGSTDQLMTTHPELAAEQAYIDHAYECLDGARAAAARLESMVEVGRGRHRAGPVRAGRHLGHDGPPARASSTWATPASCSAASTPTTRRRLLHRPGGGVRRATRAGRRRLAGAGGRALLPGDRPGADGPGPPPALRHPRPHAARHRGRAVRRLRRIALGDGATSSAERNGAHHRPRRPHRRPRDEPHRPAHRHRRHHPGRAGRDHPLRAARASSSCRAAPAPARPSSPSTAPPTSSTRTASRSRARACSSSGPTACSSATSSRCCRRWARPASSWRCWPTSSPSRRRSAASTRRSPPGSRATCAWPAVARQGGARPAPARCARRSRSATASRSCGSRPSRRSASSPTPAAGPAPTTAAASSSRQGLFDALAASAAPRGRALARSRDRLRHDPDGARGARAHVARAHAGPAAPRPVRLEAAAAPRRRRPSSSEAEVDALYRPAVGVARRRPCSRTTTCPLLDEARALLGPKPRRRMQRQRRRPRRRGPHLRPHHRRRGPGPLADAAAHARPPLAERLDDDRRRHRPGHRRVGPRVWDEVLEPPAHRAPAPRAGPSSRSATASRRRPWRWPPRCCAVAAPDLQPPRRCASDGDPPRIVRAASAGAWPAAVAAAVVDERDAVGDRQHRRRSARRRWSSRWPPPSSAAGLEFGVAPRSGLDLQVTLVPVSLVKGLEVDASVVVEPAGIVDEEAQGMRALYVGLTRATKRLCVVHARPAARRAPLNSAERSRPGPFLTADRVQRSRARGRYLRRPLADRGARRAARPRGPGRAVDARLLADEVAPGPHHLVLRRVRARRAPTPTVRYLWNSYYEAVGARHPRAQRGLLTRPTVDEVAAYRRRVDERVLDGAAAR